MALSRDWAAGGFLPRLGFRARCSRCRFRSFLSCIDAHHVLEKCVYLPKMAFLAARGGRGGGPLFPDAAGGPACCIVAGLFARGGGLCPQSSARSRGRHLATCSARRFWIGTRGAIRRVSHAFSSKFRAFAFPRYFSEIRVPGDDWGPRPLSLAVSRKE